MKFSFSKSLEGDCLVLPVWEGAKAAADFGALSPQAEKAVREFSGKGGEVAFSYGPETVMLVGLGKQDKATVEALRRAYAAVVRAATGKKIRKIKVLFPKCRQKEEFLRGIAEGILLSNYSFSYRKEGDPIVLLEEVCWIGVEKHPLLEQLKVIAEGVYFVRDWVNKNSDDKSPKEMAEMAKKLHPKVKTSIRDRKWLEKEGMGLILAVNRAADFDPYLIEATYRGDPQSKDHVVLVGKGITYDTGGLSLKPTDNMLSMKCDMAGAATVLGAVRTAAELGLKVNVTALAPVAENLIGSKSYKLGDVYSSYAGTQVEINNTDAEGRLILADALAYAVKELKPSCIVDLATLTGACVVALGEEISALFATEEDLAEELEMASDRTDELIWRLPLHEDYKEAFKSEIADLVNSGGREAGCIKAALFLKHFVKEVPWAHLDIAGPAYLNKAKHYHPVKGTGHGLRLLVDFLINRI